MSRRKRGNTDNLGLSDNPSEAFISEMMTGEAGDFEQQLQQSLSRRQSDKSGILLRDGEGDLSLLGCRVSPAGLEIPEEFSLEQLISLADILFQLETGVQLLIGDMLVATDRLGYGDIGSIAEQFNRRGKTLSNWKSTCKAVTSSLRRELFEAYPDARPLSISHYEIVQRMNTNNQQEWLEHTLQSNWTVSELRSAIREAKHTDTPASEKNVFDQWAKQGINQFRNAVSQMQPHERDKLKEMLLDIFKEFE